MKNTLINIILIISFSLLSISSYAQKLNTSYTGFSSDSLSVMNGLRFENDSILEFNYVPFHHGFGRYYVKMKYSQKDDIIHVEKANIEMQDTLLLKNIPFYYFEKDIVLKVDDKAIIDEQDNRVYVKKKDFNKNKNNITFVFNGKDYKSFSRREKKGFEKNIIENREKYKITIYRGLDAYLKYGYDAVLGGVIEVKKKEN
ncbi:hypothetical protein ACE193_24475 [Bernardetia sp. OM2101]|uniref:hypothetical protein n=1 Tax=Bernardetia sp. OM2101 TaxID=3344876 RepID=UPI0035D04533